MSNLPHETEAAPERFVVTPFFNKLVEGAYKVFDDPDMITVSRDHYTKDFAMEWPTATTAVEALANVEGFIDEAGFKEGRILQRPKVEGGKIDEQDYSLRRALREISSADPERLYAFVLSSGRTMLRWAPQWPQAYHNLHPQELSVNLPEKSKLAQRSLLQPIIAATAMSGLRDSLDQTLDEFAEYFPNLKA